MKTNTKKNTTTNTNTNRNGRKENTMKTTAKKNTTTNTTKASRNNGRKAETMKKFDIYATIADRIVEELEKGTIPWHRPWFGAVDGAYSRVTGKPYSLLNQLLLGDDGEYATMKQINAEGGKVNKGAKSKMVTFWKQYKKTVTNEQGEQEEKTFPILKYYLVFNIEDTTLEPKKRKEVHHEPHKTAERIIDGYIKTSGVKFENDKASNKAYYSPALDKVVVPRIDQFEVLEEYYSTVFHELTHSTGSKNRLNRINTNANFGSEDYGREELVAELGASSLVNICGLESEKSFKNNASYIKSWAKAIKDDPKMIVTAAGKADKAVKMIVGDTELEEEPKAKPKKTKTTKKAKAKKAEPKSGTFKKDKFYIKKRNGFDEVEGYTTKVGTLKIGLDKRNGWWYATEITTGLGACMSASKTRKEVIEDIEKSMDTLKKVTKTDRFKEAKKELAEYKKNVA